MVGPAGIIASAPRSGGVYTGPVTNNATTRYTSTSYGNPSGYSAYGSYGGSSYSRGYASNAFTSSNINTSGYTSGYTTAYNNTIQQQPNPAASPYTSSYSNDVRGRQAADYNSNLYHRTPRTSSYAGVRRTKTPVGNRYGATTHEPSNQYAAATTNYTLHRAATPGRLRPSSLAPSHWGKSRISPNRVTLVLDLDETLVHSSFEPCEADLHIPLVMDGEHYVAYVKKRPYMEQFLARCVELFDVVVWTASLAVYAEPLINELCRLSRCGSVKQMYRESCTQLQDGSYIKDLSTLNVPLDDICILDNSPSVAQMQPKNLIPIVSWYDDPNDTCLRDLIPHLDRLAGCRSVVDVIPSLPGVRAAGFW